MKITADQPLFPADQRLANVKPGAQEIRGAAFADMLKRSLSEVNNRHIAADQAIERVAKGSDADLHTTMIAMEKASLSLELMMQVRNKIIAAYDEIRRMQV
jgi:flagellar hook-basal body complex protein FliE